MREKKDIRLVIVTGLSGAGKTQAVRSLEDLGFFCVDNLPPTLIPKFAELCVQSEGRISKIALVIDIRGGEFFDQLFEGLDGLDMQGLQYEFLFLEAAEETLVRRFKESRRNHPLSPQGQILEGIREERERMEELRGRAHKIIDTTNLTSNQLKEQVRSLFEKEGARNPLTVTIMSFGYKYGIPLDADLVIDVRFLPNPHYVETLQPLTGEDIEVQEFVLQHPQTRSFIRRFASLLNFLIPHYIKEGKKHLVIAIGCTGGQHRSVTMAIKMAELLARKFNVSVKHRDSARHSVEGSNK